MQKTVLGFMVFAGMLGMGLGADANVAGASAIPPVVSAAHPANVSDPALSKQRYDMIMSQLDAGGDLLVVANLEGLVKGAVDGVTKPIMALGKNSPQAQTSIKCVEKIPGFLEKNGFYALQGFGMSALPRPDGLNTVKCFIARDPAAAGLPLWRAMVGGNPKVMECTDFLPADTELARTGTAEWRSLWKLIRAGVAEIGTPETSAAFEGKLTSWSTNMGVNLDKVFDSFSGECFFSVQLSRTSTIELPGGGSNGPVRMPQPTFLLGIAVSDNTLSSSLEAVLAKSGMVPVVNDGALNGIKTLNLPMPLPLPFQPSYTVYSNFFLLGSTPAVVAEGIKSFTSKSGLTATAQFKKAFEGLPVLNNGISYVSPRFMNTLTEVQKTFMSQQGAGEPGMAEMMEQIFSHQQDMQNAMVIQNRKSGVLTIGNSSAGGKEMISGLMMAPAALLTAVAIPSFMKAKSQSVQNSCINNMRMIEAAKEQWALEKNKNTGDAVVESEVLKYLKGNKLPVCPQGGKYTMHAVGQNCECSIPGHKMAE